MTKKLETLEGIPAGLKPEEVAALRRLGSELEFSGYRVLELGIGGGRVPVALIARRSDGKTPLRTVVTACRTLLRASEDLLHGETVTEEEYETLAAARLTLRVVRNGVRVEDSGTLGKDAHAEMAETVHRAEEGRK